MPSRDWTLRIEDMLQAMDAIEQYTRDMTLESFAADQKTIDAVIRNLEIIGEAARYVPEEVVRRHADVPWADIRGSRNVLIHQYFGVSINILWDTVARGLPALRPFLQHILNDG